MKNPVVVVGLGEMGSVFARGFLRLGYPVYPVVRGVDMSELSAQLADIGMVLIAVAEGDLHQVLANVPDGWKNKLALLQNELLPNDWEKYGLNPTVISVWFEKKKGMDSKVIIPSPVFGQHAQAIADGLGSIDITSRILNNADSLLHELVLKNVYILTTNIAGLKVGGNVGELWNDHREFAIEVASEVIQLQEQLTGESLDSSSLIDGMVEAFNGDLNHGCMGRSAPARLARALDLAEQNGLELPVLKSIAEQE